MSLISQFPDGSFRATSATIVGDATIGQLSSFWCNVVVRGDVAPIAIGQRVNVQDNSVIHCDAGHPMTIEDDVSIGHGAIIHGVHIGRGSLVGMHATILGRVRIGCECLIAAGAVVPPGMSIPDRHLAAGLPARIVRPLNDDDLAYLRMLPPRYVEIAREHLAGRYNRD
jgi:carbonic anhydrase/acetyltransferase-like protein (isoleucine patch superfamily)